MRKKAIHFNPQRGDGQTRCGRRLAKVEWRHDSKDATCDVCIRMVAHDVQAGA